MKVAKTGYESAVTRLFSMSVLRELIAGQRPKVVDEVAEYLSDDLDEFPEPTFGELFEVAYRYLLDDHRSEYVYKNVLAKRILLGQYSLNTAVMLQEFRVGRCKADVVILNGTSIAFEVKSELDTYERLEHQLDSYRKVFDLVYVVTAESQTEMVLERVDPSIGVWGVHGRADLGRTTRIREAQSGKHNTDPGMIFDCMRRTEYEFATRVAFGKVPTVPNTKIYSECKAMFTTLSPAKAHDAMVRALKRKRNNERLLEFILDAPDEFKAFAAHAKLNKNAISSFWALLSTPL